MIEDWCGDALQLRGQIEYGNGITYCHELNPQGDREKFNVGKNTYMSIRQPNGDRIKMVSPSATEADIDGRHLHLEFGPWEFDLRDQF